MNATASSQKRQQQEHERASKEFRPGMLVWWRQSPSAVWSGEVVRVAASIITISRLSVSHELHFKRVHALWRDAHSDTPLPAGER